MIVTLDTNVIMQAFHSRRGASHQILRLIRGGDLTMALSVPVFQEYREVMSREEKKALLELGQEEIDVILEFIVALARPTDVTYRWRPNLRDEADNMFLELARASASRYLVTQNIRDFLRDADLKNDDLDIVTPADFISRWRNHYGK
ncbi:MAG: putative toxin-antitoxin system toxin component, PIN family [Spirochaetaceae bacterium]